MKPAVLPLLTATSIWVAAATLVSAQSVNRIRQSINKATGGAAGAPGVPQIPVPAAPTLTPEQAAAVRAAQLKRQQEAAAEADSKVVPFLKERVEGGSADAAFDLGKRYETGKGVTADAKEARRLYQLGADRGNEEAKTWLKEHPAGAETKPSAPAPAVKPIDKK